MNMSSGCFIKKDFKSMIEVYGSKDDSTARNYIHGNKMCNHHLGLDTNGSFHEFIGIFKIILKSFRFFKRVNFGLFLGFFIHSTKIMHVAVYHDNHEGVHQAEEEPDVNHL